MTSGLRPAGRPDALNYDKISIYNLGVLKNHQARIQQLEASLGITTSTNYMENGDDASFANLNVSGNTTLSKLTVTGNATIQGTLTVSSLKVTTNIEIGGKITSRGNAPQVTDFTVLGTQTDGAEVIISGTDTAGSISFTASSVPEAITEGEETVLVEVAFASENSVEPRVSLTAKNSKSARLPVFVKAL